MIRRLAALGLAALLSSNPAETRSRDPQETPLPSCSADGAWAGFIRGYGGDKDRMAQDAQLWEGLGRAYGIWSQSERAFCLYQKLGDEEGMRRTREDYKKAKAGRY